MNNAVEKVSSFPLNSADKEKTRRHGGDREREIGSKERFSYRANVARLTDSLFTNGTPEELESLRNLSHCPRG